MNPCRTLEEVRTRAMRFIRLEDDKKTQERLTASTYPETQDRNQGSSFKNNRPKLYSRSDKQSIHVVQDEEDDEEYPKISEYCFSIDVSGLRLAMQDLGEKARWPRKNERQQPSKTNPSGVHTMKTLAMSLMSALL
jgi:hypothetical protein